MVAMSTMRCFCDGSISENVPGPNLYNCTKFHAFMTESKMVTMATMRCFCDGSISENVPGLNLYNCAKLHAFMKK